MENIVISDPIVLDLASGKIEARHLEATSDEFGSREGIVITGLAEFPNPVPLRVQSSCVFSEAFGSIDCDCANQLHAAVNRVATTGGVVIYLYEEGRGIGLRMKIEAIRIQQAAGIDTASAFAHLGLQPDPRTHEIAAGAAVKLLRDRPIVLLTNNPEKVRAMKRGGVNVVGEERLIVKTGPLVGEYLAEKARVLGHRLDEADR
jgi:GTP cyclohydrolase II